MRYGAPAQCGGAIAELGVCLVWEILIVVNLLSEMRVVPHTDKPSQVVRARESMRRTIVPTIYALLVTGAYCDSCSPGAVDD